MLPQGNKNLKMDSKYDIGDVVEYIFIPGHPNFTDVIGDIDFDEERKMYKYCLKEILFWIYESSIVRVISHAPSRKQKFKDER